jgi:SAM-dependent methyltransferase
MGDFDPGSFRDPEGRVFKHHGRVFRRLSIGAEKRVARLVNDGTIDHLVKAGLLIDSWLIPVAEAGVTEIRPEEGVMEHRLVPVITHGFEWSFAMLRDAALLTLDVILECLSRDLMLKDATPYKVMLLDGRPIFIDTLSIEDYREGQPWEGYGQFCRGFLFPLMLQAYKGLDFQPFLRTSVWGPTAGEMARIMSLRDRFRRGVFKNVAMQAYFDRLFGDQDVRKKGNTSSPKIDKRIIEANVKGLPRLVRDLDKHGPKSAWIAYERTHSYSDEEADRKRDFCTAGITHLGARHVLDLGCNTGFIADAVARSCGAVDSVIAVDLDPAVIDVLYRRQRESGTGKVVPVVSDLLDPSPAISWALRERGSFFDRLHGDAFLALALVHHVCISGNIPIKEFVAALATLAPAGILEWVDKEDAMVQVLLRNREDIFPDYTWTAFLAAVSEKFDLIEIAESHDGRRKLCLLGPPQDSVQ